jgi:hypothetical protein
VEDEVDLPPPVHPEEGRSPSIFFIANLQ